jgi:hypothetical protein
MSTSDDPWATPSDPWMSSPDPEPDASKLDGLMTLLQKQRDLIISVGTGGHPIKEVNGKYEKRRRALNAGLRSRGIEPPFPWDDLWEWYAFYSSEMGTYAERRIHVRKLAKVAEQALERLMDGVEVADPGTVGTESWAALDARVEGLVLELSRASSNDDMQDVGRRSREVLIDAAKLLADPSYVPEGTEAPKSGDAKNWLDLVLNAKAGGSRHAELRAFIRATWVLAQRVTHGDVNRVDAYAAAQATVLIVRTLQQLTEES